MEQAPKNNGQMNYAEICEFLPHRAPFLLVDRVEYLGLAEKIIAYKHVSFNEPVFAGHFPGNPIYPGVYMLEGLAQAGAILNFKTRIHLNLPDIRFAVLTGVEDVRFRRPVFPGDTLRYEVIYLRHRGNFAWMSGSIFIGDELVAEAKISASITNVIPGALT